MNQIICHIFSYYEQLFFSVFLLHNQFNVYKPTMEKMSDVKRKSFQFQKEDLDWIDPLILEWSEENEGRDKSELITQLLRDYRREKEETEENHERAQRLQDNAERITKPIQSALNPMREAFGKALNKFADKADSLNLDSKFEGANKGINTTLTRAATGLDSIANDASQRLRELRKTEE